ncbi:DEAD/DEAH box helicase family protein [Helicobacter cappadocius]|uniref:DEAD/DEAH box helicase family protein n=1 Tax=Helicobacter cappadocius TaxID=3063998 RepID=A0AA90TBN1_9HELI|nr:MULTISPECIES: DEAD/DEAH box helicase family protein [unclassified Helicobacter]MDO7252898.1 DEAD/DEAH box helicase family protein [Helicobacter sp. faydin-H75]MDP2538941.1 DEAD/DEAH box helicase family protein [Helicobacter sp. faydin-H76]
MKLCERIGIHLDDGLDIEIPLHILENLNSNIELREYQINALKYYLISQQKQKLNRSHLMFHMATGSGKTVIMASLILDCFARGYENFVFFVNSTAILEKTKQNFSNPKSSKYLFAKNITINTKNISINVCENLNTCKKGQINIIFTTVQALFSLLTLERENALTISDFQDQKIVMLADEAHHINAETKKSKSQSQAQDLQSWEGVIKAIYGANKENLMFEFSATLPKDKSVQQKYEDKIIFEYTLKDFRNDKYSKDIKLLKYEGLERIERICGAVICSLYRQELAALNHIVLKPVILFKSKTIKESKENEELFLQWIYDLRVEDIERFFNNIKEDSGILYDAKVFFQDRDMQELLRQIRREFEKHFLININDTNELQTNQILINTLEDQGNKIRVIFAVDKLNEGWDVLNLFDIVRLIEGSINDTPKEAQLIGRGARYFPFEASIDGRVIGKSNQRKFDDINSPLKALETLSYHGASENEFIARLQKELVEIGLKDDEKEIILLSLKEEFKESEIYQKCYFATNSVMRIKDEVKNSKNKSGYFTLESIQKLPICQNRIKIPLIDAHNIQEEDMIKAIDEAPEVQTTEIRKDFEFKDLDKAVIYKAMNKSGEFYTFENLKLLFKDIKSRQDFIDKYLSIIKLTIHEKQNISNPKTRLKIALLVCENFKNQMEKKLQNFEVKAWYLTPLKLIGDKFITRTKGAVVHRDMQSSAQFAFKNFVGTDLELEFVDFVQRNATKLDENFSQWWLVRNERNSQMAIYTQDNEEENKVKRFEPDFYFFAKPKEKKNFEILQCFIEPKGGHIEAMDRWKEEFLKTLLEIPKIVENDENGYYRQKVQVMGMPFFAQDKQNEFEKSFVRLLQI